MEEKAQGKKVVGECVVCEGKIVEDIVREYDPQTGPPVIGPGSRDQFRDVLRGYNCIGCGLYYKFPPRKIRRGTSAKVVAASDRPKT